MITTGCRIVVVVLVVLYGASSALGQRLVSTLSSQEISIDSTFSGESLTLFGNIEPDIGERGGDVQGPFDIIITVQGPSTERTVWRKNRVFGIWLNTQSVRFPSVPSLLHIMTTRPLFEILMPAALEENGIGLSFAATPAEDADPRLKGAFSQELIRLLQESRRFGANDRYVSFLSPTFYKARMSLPADVPNGTYLAKTYLVKNGEVIDERAERFFVRTTGIERLLSTAAKDSPLLYGVICVALALFTGWLGGVAFRR